ncbi:MAG: nuclear transport factor 2 family protein [Gaiellaceae bacterium]
MGELSRDDLAAVESAADAYVAAMNAGDWALVAQAFTEDAFRIPPHEEPHHGREAIEAWLSGIEELISYDLTRDRIGGADGFAYVRGRYAITLRLKGAPGPITDQGDFLEIWWREADGTWRVAEAIWNTRAPLDALASKDEA